MLNSADTARLSQRTKEDIDAYFGSNMLPMSFSLYKIHRYKSRVKLQITFVNFLTLQMFHMSEKVVSVSKETKILSWHGHISKILALCFSNFNKTSLDMYPTLIGLGEDFSESLNYSQIYQDI